MRCFLAVILSILMVSTPLCTAYAQASRYRVPAKVKDANKPAPSFRSGERRAFEVQPGAGMQPAMPRTHSGGERAGPGISQIVTYQVHVLGEVNRPGTFRIPASGRLADAIKLAGWLAASGSERRIQLKRRGKVIQTVDLLSFVLNGNLADNPYLLDNDVVFIPLRDNVIQVVGAVRRPETYELRNEKKLDDVIKLAGGFNAATAMTEPVRVVRFVGGEKVVEKVPIDKAAMRRFDVLNGDVIVVPNVVTGKTEFDYNIESVPGDQVFYPSYEDRVFVLGGVNLPGAYPFSPYYSVNQYISLSGGLTDRGKDKYLIIDMNGKSRRVSGTERVNPGETVMVKQRWMSPAGWLGFALGIASFGLSASATIIAISR